MAIRTIQAPIPASSIADRHLASRVSETTGDSVPRRALGLIEVMKNFTPVQANIRAV